MKFFFKKKKNNENDINDKDLIDFMKKYRSKLANEYKQEFASCLKDQVSGVCNQFKQNLGRSFWKKWQKWCDWGPQGPILQPNQSRLFYKKGDVEVMVIEENPQVRTLFFGDDFSYAEKSSYSLSLPYVVYLFTFHDRTFRSLHCFFNDRPLSDLDDKLYIPFLTNINDFQCCLGNSFLIPSDARNDHNKIVQYTLNYFWNAAHNHHWDYNFRSNINHFKRSDARLASLQAWEENTLKNPLFVIDDVSWMQGQVSLSSMILKMVKSNVAIRNLEEDIFSVLAEDLLKDVLEVSVESLVESTEAINDQKDEVFEKNLSKLLKKFKLSGE